MRIHVFFVILLLVVAVALLSAERAFSEAPNVSQHGRFVLEIEEQWSVGNNPSDVVIGYITAACVDSASNIYAADLRMKCIYKFNSNGKYLETYDSYGEGPGDLMFGAVIAIDSKSRMYMAGMGGRVQILDTNWEYIGGFDREHPEGFARSIAVAPSGHIFIGAVDIIEQTAFDVYDSHFTLLGSFSETFGAGTKLDWRTESLFAGGYLTIGPNEELYYVQMTPFEVRKFNKDLKFDTKTVDAGGEFVLPPPEVQFSEGKAKASLGSAASGIVALESGDVVVTAYRKEGQSGTESLVIVYSSQLELIAKAVVNGVYTVAGRNNNGAVFFWMKDENGPRFVQAELVY